MKYYYGVAPCITIQSVNAYYEYFKIPLFVIQEKCFNNTLTQMLFSIIARA
jgi:hypothetical protein